MKKDCIAIDNLKCFAHHGVYDFETEKGQNFYVSARLYTNTEKAGLSDELTDSTNYGDVCHFIDRFMKENTYRLIEAVAENLAKAILLNYDLISEIELTVSKPEAPIGLPFENVSVTITRGWHRVYLSAGSNMGDSRANINGAIGMLSADDSIKNVVTSKMYVTKPYGGVIQDDFINCCIALDTLYSPAKLLEKLHEIEQAYDRKREIHWGPRTLDLDIVFYDKLVYEDDNLIIPHVDMHNREFVLKPLADLIPNFRHPILQQTVANLLKMLVEKA